MAKLTIFVISPTEKFGIALILASGWCTHTIIILFPEWITLIWNIVGAVIKVRRS